MIWIAGVLGAFLFYKFVERKHKIIVFKTAAAAATLGAVLIGGFLGYNSFENSRRKNGITVEFDYKDLKFEKSVIRKLVDSSFKNLSSTVSSYYPGLNESDRVKLKEQLFYSYLEVKDAPGFAVVVPDDEIKALFAWFENKSDSNEKYLRKLENARAKRVLNELKTKRTTLVSPLQNMLHIAYLNRTKDSFSFDDIKKVFMDGLTQGEKSGIANFSAIKDASYDELYSAINNHNDLKTVYSFTICNKRQSPLQSYSFSVSGFERGRSTAQALRKTGDYGSSTHFSGDIIIEPNKCSAIQWTGDYKFFNRYEISGIYGSWKE